MVCQKSSYGTKQSENEAIEILQEVHKKQHKEMLEITNKLKLTNEKLERLKDIKENRNEELTDLVALSNPNNWYGMTWFVIKVWAKKDQETMKKAIINMQANIKEPLGCGRMGTDRIYLTDELTRLGYWWQYVGEFQFIPEVAFIFAGEKGNY